MNARTAGTVGTSQLKILVMVNTKTKFPRGILDQAISGKNWTECKTRSPGPGLKPQATSSQASSDKHQAPSYKRQASSRKQQAPQ